MTEPDPHCEACPFIACLGCNYQPETTVCIAHGRFIPCRKDGEHRYTSNPYWVKSVRDYQGSTIENLTWEPAWERNTSAKP